MHAPAYLLHVRGGFVAGGAGSGRLGGRRPQRRVGGCARTQTHRQTDRLTDWPTRKMGDVRSGGWGAALARRQTDSGKPTRKMGACDAKIWLPEPQP
jgi:hypothetical protein